MEYDTKLLKKMVGSAIATGESMTDKFIKELIDGESEMDEVGCQLEMMKAAAEEALRFYNKFYESRPEHFKDVKVKRGDYCVEWEYLGEGSDGDYNWQDVEDYPHLRANLTYKGKPCTDGSYCTLASTKTPLKELNAASTQLIADVIIAGGVDLGGDKISSVSEVSFPDRIMQKWTWRTYKVI
jgi:hypothetical protein